MLLLINKWSDELQRHSYVNAIKLLNSDFFLDHFKSSNVLKYVHHSCSVNRLLLLSALLPYGHEIGWRIRIQQSVSLVSLDESVKFTWYITLLNSTSSSNEGCAEKLFSMWDKVSFWATGIIVIELEMIFSCMHLEIADLICFFMLFFPVLAELISTSLLECELLLTFPQINTWIVSISWDSDWKRLPSTVILNQECSTWTQGGSNKNISE